MATQRYGVLKTNLAVWSAGYLTWTAQTVLQGVDYPLDRALRRLFVFAFALALSALVWPYLRRVNRLEPLLRAAMAGAVLAGCSLATACVTFLLVEVFRPLTPTDPSDIVSEALLFFWAYAAWAAVCGLVERPQADHPGDAAVQAIWISVRGGRRRLDAHEIVWIEAQRECVLIHTADHAYLVRNSLRAIQTELGQDRFIRARRSALVNVRAVDRVEAGKMLVLKNGARLKVGRAYEQGLNRSLQLNRSA